MTPDNIRAAIQADPALQALMPDTQAIAAALSVGRTRVTTRLGGVGVVLDALGPVEGAAVLDTLDALKASIVAAEKRTANRAEAALATGIGSTATPGTLTFEGGIDGATASQIRSQ